MKILIQRVSKASITINNSIYSQIEKGVVVFVGITHTDTEKNIEKLVDKIMNLRIFEDENGKLNLSLKEIKGECLIVSQFTLYADCNKGRRPAFNNVAKPGDAVTLYNQFIKEMKKQDIKVETGIFGEYMEVALVNDGPVTIILEN